MPQTLLLASTQLAEALPFNIGEKAQDIIPMIGASNSGDDSYRSNFSYLVTSLMSFIMAIAALAVLLFLLFGAIEWISSGGDKNKLESARNKMMHAALGIIILSATTAIFMVIQQFVGIRVINFVGGSAPNYSYACMDVHACGIINGNVVVDNNGTCRGGCAHSNICCQSN
ncbi:MAG: hypothetical protein ABIJ03_01805 [Patescibacteria group bacterium]|nr:hypothetical protein [Patescibacteria group bacterium]